MQRRWRLEAIENEADGALILTATYDNSLPVGETWASSRSKWTHLYPITNLNFDRVTNHGGCPPVARCGALKFYQASNPGAAHLIRNLRAGHLIKVSLPKINLDPIETGWPWVSPARTSNV